MRLVSSLRERSTIAHGIQMISLDGRIIVLLRDVFLGCRVVPLILSVVKLTARLIWLLIVMLNLNLLIFRRDKLLNVRRIQHVRAELTHVVMARSIVIHDGRILY